MLLLKLKLHRLFQQQRNYFHHKNILNFCGKPLVAWSVIQAKLTKEIDEVYISSDSDKILDIAESYGAKKIKRPDEISGDEAKSEEAILHALNVIGNKHKCIIMIEPTAPLRKPNDLSNAINLFSKNKHFKVLGPSEAPISKIKNRWRVNSLIAAKKNDPRS